MGLSSPVFRVTTVERQPTYHVDDVFVSNGHTPRQKSSVRGLFFCDLPLYLYVYLINLYIFLFIFVHLSTQKTNQNPELWRIVFFIYLASDPHICRRPMVGATILILRRLPVHVYDSPLLCWGRRI